MDNLNKITHTRVGDSIHYYINGKEGRGTVVKMNSAYVSVLKESGKKVTGFNCFDQKSVP